MTSEPVTSNPLSYASTSASALAPQLSALSVTAADQPAAASAAAESDAAVTQEPTIGASSSSKSSLSYDGATHKASPPVSRREVASCDGIGESSLAAQRRPSGLASTRPMDASKTPEALDLLENQVETEPGYPSPSGAFMPPGTDEDWKPQDGTKPIVRNGQGVLDQRRASKSSVGTEEQHPARPTSIPSSQATTERIKRASSRAASRRGSAANVERASLDGGSTSGGVFNNSRGSVRRPSRVADHAESPLQSTGTDGRTQAEPIPVGKRSDSNAMEDAAAASSSSSSFLGGSAHSQAISARSSPSTVAPLRRPSSGLGALASSGRDSEQQSRTSGVATGDQDVSSVDTELLPPLKIRDFGFPDADPRHIGAREAGVGSPLQHSMSPSSKGGFGGFGGGLVGGPVHEWSIGGIDHDADDEDDIVDEPDVYGDHDGASDDDSFAEGLPLGLYHAAYDFAAESEHELDVKVGQRVRLVGHVDGGWAIVMRVRDGEADVDMNDETVDRGLVPEAYLQWLGA